MLVQCCWLDARTGHYVVVSLGKTLFATFLRVLYVVWKISTDVCFTTAKTGEKNKKQTDMVLSVSPIAGMVNNCPILNVVPQVRRIYRTN